MIGMPEKPVYAILTNSKAENVNANAVNVAVVDGKTITQTVDLGAAKTGLPVRIKAVQGGKYIIGEGDKGIAPENLTIKRVGKNLHIALEGTDPDQAQLIIENFEGSGGQLVGLAEDGSYYEYISSDADQDGAAAFLYEGAESAQVLGAQPLAGFGNGLVAGSGIGWFWPALLGLGALGLLGGIYAATRDSDSKKDAAAVGNTDKGSLGGAHDNVGDKQGLIGNGESTDDKTPTFTGVGKPGTTVEIVDNGKVIGTAPVGEDGKWEFTPPAPGLGEGSHNIVIVPVDGEGNKGEPSPGHVIIVDTVAPAAALIEGVYDNVAPQEGLLASGASTNDTTPTLSGTAEAGSIIHIFDNGTEIGSVKADADGVWEFTPETALVEGDHEFTITAEDAAGNISVPSAPFPIVIDVTAPDKPGPGTGGIDDIFDNFGPDQGSIGDGDSTDDKTPTFTGGGATPGDTVVIIDNGDVIGSVKVDDDGNWEFTPDPELGTGPHEIVVVIKDPAGNESEPSDPVTIIVVDDVTPPVKPTPGAGGIEIITDDIGPDKGIIGDGDTTDDTAPTFGGSGAVPGDIVTIIDNGTPIGSVEVDAGGNWEFTPGPGDELADGPHEIVVVITDPSGNESEPSDPITIIVDTVAPAVPVLGPVLDDQGDSTGELNSNDITDDAQPEFTGTAEPGSLVILYDNGTPVGSIHADGDGNWSITPNLPLINGPHTMTVTSTDAAGNVSAPTADFQLEVIAGGSATAPAITGVMDDQGSSQGLVQQNEFTDDNEPTVTGTGSEGDVITLYSNGTAVGSTTVVDGQWSITPSPALMDGPNNLTAQAMNGGGNLSPVTGAYPINVDTSAPLAPTDLSLTDDFGDVVGAIGDVIPTDDANPTFAGMAEADALVFIYDNGNPTPIGSARADAFGNWEFTPTVGLMDGDHSFTARAEDAAGNLGPASPAMNFSVDTSAVVISITSVTDNFGTNQGPLANGQPTDDTTPTLSGMATPGSVVTIYDGATIVGSIVAHATTGAWEITTAPLSAGVHNLTATSTTPATGESAPTEPFELNVDLTPPATPTIGDVQDDVGAPQGTIADGGITDDITPTLSGSGLVFGDTVEIYDGLTLLDSVTVRADGTWNYTTNPLIDGPHVFTIVARDPAGNPSAPSAPWTVVVDATPPPAPVIASLTDDVSFATPPVPETILDGGVTDDRSPVINGTAEPGSTVTIYANGVELGTADADPVTGAWTFEPATPLELGPYSLTATATDAAGNIGPESVLFEFDLVSIFASPVVTDNFPGDPVPGGSGAGRLSTGKVYDMGVFNVTRVDLTGTIQSVAADTGIRITNGQGQNGSSKLVFDLKGEESHTLSLFIQATSGGGSGPALPVGAVMGSIKLYDAAGEEVGSYDIRNELDRGYATIQSDVPFASFELVKNESASSRQDSILIDNVIISDNQPTITSDFPGDPHSTGTILLEGKTYDLDEFTITRHTSGTPGVTRSDGAIVLSSNLSNRGETTVVFDLKGAETSTLSLEIRLQSTGLAAGGPAGVIRFYDATGMEIHSHVIRAGEIEKGISTFVTDQPFASFEVTQYASIGPNPESLYLDNIILSPIDPSSTAAADIVDTTAVEQLFTVAEGEEASIAAEGTDAIDTLSLTGANQVLDLTALAEGQVTSMEVIDITGTGNNTLNLSLGDVLAQGGNSLFTGDDATQMMIKGNAGDVVNLADLLPDGTDPGDWASAGTATVAGVVYNVFQHSSQDAQLLVQDGVTTNLV